MGQRVLYFVLNNLRDLRNKVSPIAKSVIGTDLISNKSRRIFYGGVISAGIAAAYYYNENSVWSNTCANFALDAAEQDKGKRNRKTSPGQGEMSNKALKAIVFMGSVRDGRNAAKVAKFVTNKLVEAKYEVDVWDPQELALPLLKQPLQFYPDPKQAPKILQDLNEKIKAADVYVVLTAEYNRQMPPALTNLLDHFPPVSYSFKSSAIVSYSMGSGGASAAAQARTLMVEFGAPPIPYVLGITQVHNSLDESGEAKNEYLHKAASKMITQLDWFAAAMRSRRDQVGVPAWEGAAVSV